MNDKKLDEQLEAVMNEHPHNYPPETRNEDLARLKSRADVHDMWMRSLAEKEAGRQQLVWWLWHAKEAREAIEKRGDN